MSPPIDIDGSEIQEATIDGQDVSEITIDGQQAADLNVIPDSVVDDFEDNNLNEWSNTANVAITATSVLEGQHSLQITSSVSSAGSRPFSLQGDGLESYPQKGDKFSCFLFEGSGPDSVIPAFSFGVADNTNGIDGYEIFHQPAIDPSEIGIRRLDDGTATVLDNPDVSGLSTDQTYEFEIQWHDGSGAEPDNTIELTIYETNESANLSDELGRSSEIFNTTVSDSTYASNRGIGISNGSGDVNGENRIDRYWLLGSVE